ncbi:hypothetical protein HanIR_Chr13g0664951 [Helianthus annuus]|nr:hypothetical protein HanIR_Chr13g0664951 [Helianthus annuus]
MILLQHSPTFPPRFVVLRGRGVTAHSRRTPLLSFVFIYYCQLRSATYWTTVRLRSAAH